MAKRRYTVEQIVSKLLTEMLSFAPEDRDGHKGLRFKAVGSFEKLISGALSKVSQAVVSPRGTVLLYQLKIRGETRRAA